MVYRRLSPKERLECLQIYFSASKKKTAAAQGGGVVAEPTSVAALCRSRGIARTTFYRWKQRFTAEGHRGLFDRPAGRPPLPQRTVIPQELIQRMVFWRRWLGLSLRQIQEALRCFLIVSHVTVRRVLRLWGAPGRVYKRRKKRWQRFERSQPDELWQIDHSLSDFDGQWRLTILDDHSRMVLCCQPVPSQSSPWVCALLLRTIQQLGGRKPKQLLSDHGSAFRNHALWQLLRVLGIRPVYARVRHPQTVGKLERFHRTFQEQAWLFETPQAFVYYYNSERAHGALAGQTPAERYWPTTTEEVKKAPKLTRLGRTVTRFG
jgi:transposase InsO family protein